VFGEGGRIPWTSLVQHLIQREDPSLRHVALYTFEGWTAAPLQFLLANQGSQQFDVEVTEPGLIGGGHFWVAFREPTPRVQDQPRSLLEQRGCRLDAEWSVHDGGQRLTVFRANC
jgi:hypothetical protein